MPKKAQEFIIDAALGEKKYEIQKPEQSEEKIFLSIEENAIPAALLKDAKAGAKERKEKNFLSRADEFLRSLGSPGARDKAAFFRLLSILINAGVPLIKALDTVAEQTFNSKLKMSIFEIARFIEKGGNLSESMAKFPSIFADSHLGVIKSGEASGQLNQVLKQLATEVEKSASIKRKVKGAMMYPAFVMIVMLIVVFVMMVVVVPKISVIFMDTGKELPTLTKVVIGISNFMQNQWAWIIGGVVGLIFAFIVARRTPQGKYSTDWMLLHLPFFGPLLQKSILARFARSLGNLLTSGVPIIQGLLINAKGLGNEVYKRRVTLASEDIARGIPLGESLRDSPEFPSMITQMIAVGEQTAQLDQISQKIAEYYEEEVDVAVQGLSKAMEPAILVVVGLVVGAIIGAIMLPIMQLSQIAG